MDNHFRIFSTACYSVLINFCFPHCMCINDNKATNPIEASQGKQSSTHQLHFVSWRAWKLIRYFRITRVCSGRENYFWHAGQNVRQDFGALPDILRMCQGVSQRVIY